VSIAVDVLPGEPNEGIEVFGSAGTIKLDVPFPFYRLASTVRAYSRGETIMPTSTDGDAYRRQAEAFARVIREGGRPTLDVTMAWLPSSSSRRPRPPSNVGTR
jgi:predicted dehydrogenase